MCDDDPKQGDENGAANAAPVGDGAHEVVAGEDFETIARDAGFDWKTLWEHPGNQKLRDERKHHDCLLPGDRVHIPERRPRTEERPTGKTHRFRRKGLSSRLRVRVLRGGRPLAGADYSLEVDDHVHKGTTGSEGTLEHLVPVTAVEATLRVGKDRAWRTFRLRIGHLDPANSVRGVQMRLNNLGFPCGEPTGEMDPATTRALARFQRTRKLKPSGVPDEDTVAALAKAHGS